MKTEPKADIALSWIAISIALLAFMLAVFGLVGCTKPAPCRGDWCPPDYAAEEAAREVFDGGPDAGLCFRYGARKP